jgi:RNA polymerase sigma-70 factor, ECF subfamily
MGVLLFGTGDAFHGWETPGRIRDGSGIIFGDMEITERKIRAAWEGSDFQSAAELSISSYGPEIYGFIMGFVRTESDAEEVYSSFLEDFWRGFPTFEWGCAVRTWAYTLARNATIRFSTRSKARRRRHQPLSDMPGLAAAAEQARTSTIRYLRTEMKSRIRELRKQLPEPEQMLLVLRIDRGLSWRDIALVLADGSGASAPSELERAEVVLRKQLERTKTRLRRLAEQDGLIAPRCRSRGTRPQPPGRAS